MSMTNLYEFNRDDVYRFAQTMGSMTKQRGNELVFKICPLCNGGSGSKRDFNTFSINLQNGQCECKRHSCGYKGNLITLSRDVSGFELTETVSRYYNINNRNDGFRKFKESTKHFESNDPAIAYLQNRGISEATCKQYEITSKNNLLIFPFKNQDGELKFIKYRKMDFDKDRDKSKEWCESNCMPILFGMNHADPNDGPLIITEGQIDSLSVAESGLLNAVSVPTGCNGFTWVGHCWNWFQSFKELIIFGDFENGQMTLMELAQKFNGVVRVVREKDYQGCKDANEILQRYGAEAVVNAVMNAKNLEPDLVVNIGDVEEVDLTSLECISTGMKEIDDILSGGFHVGELILLTGKRGDGKSTFMSQLMVNARRQNYKCFAYSGELTNVFFRNWIDMQVTGKKKHLPSEGQRINEYYRNTMYLYDSTHVSFENEMEILLKTIETVIQRYGCKFICVDNLMTAVDSSTNEKLYRMQSQFVGDLKNIAKKYDVVVILVAHPRKSNGYEFQNDDVSGSADITNKVDVVMSYNRPKDEDGQDESCRQLLITKNRLTGKLTNDRRKILLYYCDSNKRIAGADKYFDYDTGWQGVEPIESIGEEECPFG